MDSLCADLEYLGGGGHNFWLWLPLLGDLSAVLMPAWGAFFDALWHLFRY